MTNLSFYIVFIATIFLSHFDSGHSSPVENLTCHKQISNTLSYLTTKSPYLYEEQNLEYTPEGCTAEKIWYFGRHGTRNPGDDEILYMQNDLPALLRDIILNYKANRGSLCPGELSNLKSWLRYPGLNVSEEKYLVERGRKELNGIASRYKTRFPHLFPHTFNNESYYFKYTDSQRTGATAHAFANGIFGSEGSSDVWYPPAKKYDPILKFYKKCSKWLDHVENNPEAKAEKTLFENSRYINETLFRVSQRLGFLRNLSLAEVNMIYITCSFETAWKDGIIISPWCAAFDDDDFSAMNFREDLDYYWIDGYGKQINYEQACPPIKDVVNIFNQLNSTRTVTGYFTHSGAILKVLARLGLYKDQIPLTVSEYEMLKQGRQWNTSHIDTMASNMAFVLFNCPNKEQKQHIGYYFQEKPTKLKACSDNWTCPYDDFKEYFAEIISTCNLKEICKLTDENNNSPN